MGAHQVDLAGAAEEIAAAQPGHDAAGAVVDRHHGDLRPVGHLAALLGDELAERALQFEAQRRRHDRAGRLAGQPGREMRRVHRHGEPCVGTGRLTALSNSARSMHAVLQPARQHAVAGGLRRGRRAVGPAALGDCGMATSSAASAALSCRGSLPK